MLCVIVIFFCHLPRQEAAGALWNLSFDDRNREAIALVGGVEALVHLFNHPVSFYISSYKNFKDPFLFLFLDAIFSNML